MQAVIQRVLKARVVVGRHVAGEIGPGLCVLVGVTHTDGPAEASQLAAKVAGVRLFEDEGGVMNRSVVEAGGAVLVVSQFTLYGDTSRGRRPSWSAAAPGQVAEPLVQAVVDELRRLALTVEPSGSRLEMHPVDVAALAAHPQALVLQVQVGDVAGQDLLGPGRGLIQQPPQALLPDGHVVAAEQALE